MTFKELDIKSQIFLLLFFRQQGNEDDLSRFLISYVEGMTDKI